LEREREGDDGRRRVAGERLGEERKVASGVERKDLGPESGCFERGREVAQAEILLDLRADERHPRAGVLSSVGW
jgi:hypothetical protein